jgi:hypothetical protein
MSPRNNSWSRKGLYFQPAGAQDGEDARVGTAERHPGNALRDGGAVVVD